MSKNTPTGKATRCTRKNRDTTRCKNTVIVGTDCGKHGRSVAAPTTKRGFGPALAPVLAPHERPPTPAAPGKATLPLVLTRKASYPVAGHYNFGKWVTSEDSTILTAPDGAQYIAYGVLLDAEVGAAVSLSCTVTDRTNTRGQTIVKRPRLVGRSRPYVLKMPDGTTVPFSANPSAVADGTALLRAANRHLGFEPRSGRVLVDVPTMRVTRVLTMEEAEEYWEDTA